MPCQVALAVSRVELADGVRAAGQAQARRRSCRTGRVAVRRRGRARGRARPGRPPPSRSGPGDAPDEVGIEALVAGRDRRVDGEHAVAPDRRPRPSSRVSAAGDVLAGPLGEQERRVALVEVPDRRASGRARGGRGRRRCPRTSSWWRRISRPRTYRMLVIGRSASAFSGDVRVEQQDRDAADLGEPDRDRQVAPGQLDGDRQGQAGRRPGRGRAAGGSGRSRGSRAPGGRRHRSTGGSSPCDRAARRRSPAGPCRWPTSCGRRRGRRGRRSRCRATRGGRTRRRSRRSGPSARRRSGAGTSGPEPLAM